MVSVMSPIRITAAGKRNVEPIIALAHCSKLTRIIVTGANSAEAVIDLHRLGYARATTTSNCGLPAGQYEVVLLDGRQRSINAIETTLDWVADFLSRTGVLIVWLDPLQPAIGRPLRTVLESHGFRIEAGTVWLGRCGAALRIKADLQGGMRSDAAIRFAGLAGRPNSRMAPAPSAFCHHPRSERRSGCICHRR